jgi:hypothetical protein
MEINIQELFTQTFGGNGGGSFTGRGIETIAIRHGSQVDAIIINGEKFGGDGGSMAGPITLKKDEYIDRMEIRHGGVIDYLLIHTNKNQEIRGGGTGGDFSKIEGIIVAIGGRSGARVDQLQILGDFK